MTRPLTCLILAAGLALPAHGAVTFDSSIECGNGEAFTQTAGDTYSFEIEADTNAADRQWFHFAVSGAAGRTLTLRVLNIEDTNVPSHWRHARPVASSDGGATWHRVRGLVSTDGDEYRFTHTFTGDGERIALHFPYTLTHAQERLTHWAGHPDVTRIEIGRSVEGRPIELLRITHGPAAPADGKSGVWVVARQHAAETPGSWMMDGLVEFLLSDDARADALRRAAVFNVVPMCNPDGVFAGNYRQNAAGVNLNRVWNAPDPATSPEIQAIVDAIAAWVAEGHSYDFFADLHADSGALSNYAFHPPPGMMPPPYHERLLDILHRVEQIAPDFTARRGESGSRGRGVSRQSQMFGHGVLALLFENGYTYPAYGPQAHRYMTPARHAAIGEAIGLALHGHFLE